MTVPEPGNGQRGLSQRELIIEVRDDVRSLSEKLAVYERGLSKRPTRAEVYGLFILTGAVAGIVISIAGFVDSLL